LTVPSQSIYSLMSIFIGNQEKFQTNSSVHNINTRNKHHLHKPVANLSCFQKGASYSGIRIFNSLPRSFTNLKNKKTQFKVALIKFLNAHSFYSVDEFFTCTDDMYCWPHDCVNVSYTVTFLLFVCLWHVPHPIVLWLLRIYGMYVCARILRLLAYCSVLQAPVVIQSVVANINGKLNSSATRYKLRVLHGSFFLYIYIIYCMFHNIVILLAHDYISLALKSHIHYFFSIWYLR
jgi:hypothetical protein